MKHISHIVITLFLATVCTMVHGQGFLRTNGKAIVNASGDTVLLRGMGLGGWMLQEGYMLQTASFANAQYKIRQKIEALIGTADTDIFYDTWLANHVRKIDIDSLKAWGFNSVRLPMHYNLFTLPIEDEPIPGEQTWLTKGFELTDSLISWCAQNEMYVILDLHAAPGGQGYDQGISDYDPSKPSLWESQANKDKTVALWKRLAERYKDETWVGGYDLINEVNWNMSGNAPLRALYGQITDSIRSVDNNHIIFIEGNWFANDFTGLTPPWDDNMVYSPHKYWSFNDPGSIQWVLSLQEDHDVPLYFGECGENSNTWFRDAIRLFEDHDIGWAWWPMKKIESIAGPVSVIKTPDYQTLLNYWENGGSQPGSFFARAALMEVADNLRLENCIYQKDVIDAMFRQVYSNEGKPYATLNIPGIIHASDFDMGRAGVSYFDADLANYHVSTGNFTAWNTGWIYRNDGVDIERSADPVNSNGFNVGWIDEGEWMDYTVHVAEGGVYDLLVRVATAGFDGRFRFSANGSDITTTRYVPNTGGYQTWQEMVVPDVVLGPSDNKLRFHADGKGFNVSSFEFVKLGPSSSVDTKFLTAYTEDPSQIRINLNKPLEGPLPSASADFQVFVTGGTADITGVALDVENARSILLTVDYVFTADDVIKVSYSGDQIYAQDTTVLNPFSLKDVQNILPIIHDVPGRVEAEDYFFQIGVSEENTLDTGGGRNIGHLDIGDYLDYIIDVSKTGTYEISYRTAAPSENGAVKLQLIDDDGNASQLNSISFNPTGDWQSWATTTSSLNLTKGEHHVRLLITQSQFNLNWFEFTFLTSVDPLEETLSFNVYPNPGSGLFWVQATLDRPQNVRIRLFNAMGQLMVEKEEVAMPDLRTEMDLGGFANGYYFLQVELEDGRVMRRKLMKVE